jgi:hypothetical protein
MERVYDEAGYVLKEGDMSGHKWFSLWEPWLPDGFLEHRVRSRERERV